MNLPKWILERKDLSENYGYTHDRVLIEAIVIAVEAMSLETTSNPSQLSVRNMRGRLRRALRRIDELGR